MTVASSCVACYFFCSKKKHLKANKKRNVLLRTKTKNELYLKNDKHQTTFLYYCLLPLNPSRLEQFKVTKRRTHKNKV